MKQQSTGSFFSSTLVMLLLLLSHTSTSAIAGEVEDEKEFDYIEGSEKGPRHWGKLNKEWAACEAGNLQSPIDMSSQRVKVIKKPAKLNRNYKPSNATVKNRGHDISLQWEGHNAGSITINGTEYFLQQCHWHSPSEHTIYGRRYDMELHMVHESPDPNVKNKIAVVGVMYKIGHRPDAFLSKLLGDIKSMANQKLKIPKGIVDPKEIKVGGKKYYRYMGSLTVPPCTEGVIWTISRKIRTVSKQEVTALREAVHDHAERNARPVQPLNGREVELYISNQD
ncbi:hypothetical protein K2173_001932 [Erythroxylum novogranatense]|uniref:Carbonic anhydrase n=1 Tax=Erythroxylum novogranatense TaxID=1862640 RepID=A0AAV8SQ47_9ROSI|nr:hypothetical protein K2173_001932 [Erythroxylum novogranatense]